MNTAITRLLAVTVVAALLPACATVTRGTKQQYTIVSEPSGADVTLTTGVTCVTPCKLKLKRKDSFTAKFVKPGFVPAEAKVQSKFSGGGGVAGAGNVLIGGIIGAAVDGSNGSLNSLFPGKLDVKLAPVAVAAAPAEAVPAVAVTEAGATAAPLPAPAVTSGRDVLEATPAAPAPAEPSAAAPAETTQTAL